MLQLQRKAQIGVNARLNFGPLSLQAGQAEGRIVTGGRVVPALQSAVGVAEIVVRRRQFRLQPHRLLQVRQRFFRLPLHDQELTEIAVRQGELGVRGQRGAEGAHGLVDPPQLAQGVAEVILSHREIGPHVQSGAILLDRLRKTAELVERQAEVIGRLGKNRLQTERGPAAVGGVFAPAQRTVDFGQVRVVSGEIRL